MSEKALAEEKEYFDQLKREYSQIFQYVRYGKTAIPPKDVLKRSLKPMVDVFYKYREMDADEERRLNELQAELKFGRRRSARKSVGKKKSTRRARKSIGKKKSTRRARKQ